MTTDNNDMTTSWEGSEAERHFNAGVKAWQQGNNEAAAQSFSTAALMAPGWAGPHANLAAILRRLGKPEAALAACRRAAHLDPQSPAIQSNMGNALRDLGRLDEAVAALNRAVRLDPTGVGYAYNLALALRDARRHDEAEALLEKIAADNPGNAEYEWDLALSRLYRGDYQRGFAGYEARLGLARNPKRDIPGPRWTGGPIVGKRLLVASEQGFGDALQFARYIPILAEMGAQIVLECLPELIELFTCLPGLVAVVAKGAMAPPYDCWIPLISLPHVLGTTFATVPAAIPYLKAPPRPNLVMPRPPGSRIRAGLVWAGKTTPRDRSWPLESLLPLFDDPRVTFVSLQTGPRAEDLDRLGIRRLVMDGGRAVTSFADTAAVMERLDLVITIDTATAHLAGALGRPTWTLLRYVSDWRWQDEPVTTPWYPTMRLFRQPRPDDFATPVDEMAATLATWAPAS